MCTLEGRGKVASRTGFTRCKSAPCHLARGEMLAKARDIGNGYNDINRRKLRHMDPEVTRTLKQPLSLRPKLGRNLEHELEVEDNLHQVDLEGQLLEKPAPTHAYSWRGRSDTPKCVAR
jgi:hypothetical protein